MLWFLDKHWLQRSINLLVAIDDTYVRSLNKHLSAKFFIDINTRYRTEFSNILCVSDALHNHPMTFDLTHRITNCHKFVSNYGRARLQLADIH